MTKDLHIENSTVPRHFDKIEGLWIRLLIFFFFSKLATAADKTDWALTNNSGAFLKSERRFSAATRRLAAFKPSCAFERLGLFLLLLLLNDLISHAQLLTNLSLFLKGCFFWLDSCFNPTSRYTKSRFCFFNCMILDKKNLVVLDGLCTLAILLPHSNWHGGILLTLQDNDLDSWLALSSLRLATSSDFALTSDLVVVPQLLTQLVRVHWLTLLSNRTV